MSFELTDRQLDLMDVLWDRGSGTVREVKEALDEDLAYTSVLTVFQTLEKNGKVRYEQEGKKYRYYPAVSREEAGEKAVRYLLQRVFDGSVSALEGTVRRVCEQAERTSRSDHTKFRDGLPED